MSVAPLGSENANAKVCDDPLPEFGVTETGAGGPPLLAPVTVSDAVAVWFKDPLAPVTVMVKPPAEALPVVVMVSVVEPEPVIVVGLKLPVTPEGNADTPKLTVPSKPLLPVTVTAYCALPPAAMLPGPIDMLSEKSGEGLPPVVTVQAP